MEVDNGDGVFRSSNLERAADSPSRFVTYDKITNFLKTYAGSSNSDVEDAITSLAKKIPYVKLSALRTNSDPDSLKEVGYAQILGVGGPGGLDLRSAIEGSCLEINSGGTTTVASEYERDKNPHQFNRIDGPAVNSGGFGLGSWLFDPPVRLRGNVRLTLKPSPCGIVDIDN